ncbi:MAG: hypothetical protein QM761_13430 [Pseudoxanthomonas sp.]
MNLAVAGTAALILTLLAPSARTQAAPGDFGMYADPSANAARLSDADATCEQLYAEATWLEKRIAAQPKPQDPMEAVRQMQEDMQKAQQKMMGGARAKGLATSLLGMVPGVGGLAAGAVSSIASAASRPNANALQESMNKSMQAQQEGLAAYARIASLGARQEHVTQLFLDRQCKVSTLNQNAVARATTHLADSEGASAGPVYVASAGDAVATPTQMAEGDAIAAPVPAAGENAAQASPTETVAPDPPDPATENATDTPAPD